MVRRIVADENGKVYRAVVITTKHLADGDPIIVEHIEGPYTKRGTATARVSNHENHAERFNLYHAADSASRPARPGYLRITRIDVAGQVEESELDWKVSP